jgi:pimeloyl-ACP methyl ester carboxylesterase
MPLATTEDGVRLYYEESGDGAPLVFVHEFGGDHRSWKPQLRHFSQRYRCIAVNARGYPPSDVPEDPEHYSQNRARDDVIAVLDHLHIERAHLVGFSMGAYATLHVGLAHPERARSLVIVGCGYGALPGQERAFRSECEAAAQAFDDDWQAAVARFAAGPTRVQLQRKDLRAWQEFAAALAGHSADGAVKTLRGIQMRRPLLHQLTEEMARIALPTLIMAGDEDEPCLEAGLLMKRTIPAAGLVVFPRSGHAINLEEPEAFNRVVADFLVAVEEGGWGPRDGRGTSSGILGFTPRPRIGTTEGS